MATVTLGIQKNTLKVMTVLLSTCGRIPGGEVTIKQRVVTRVWTGKNRVKKVTVGAKLTPSEITYCTIFLFVLNFNWLD